MSVVDSSVIPLPLPGSTDLLLLWLVSHHGNPWILTPSAILGSILGGYTCWSTGCKGGETALQRYVQARLLRRVSRWMEEHAVLSVFLPSILPPPIPLSPFLLAAGALGVSRNRFLIVFGAARTLRYGAISWLAVVYGRAMVRLWAATLQKWSTPLICAFLSMVVIGIALGIWKLRGQRISSGTGKGPLKTASVS